MLKRCRKSLRILLLTLLVGGLGCVLFLSPLGVYLEEEVGLRLLFLARGVRQAPKQIVVINLDRNTAHFLDLPDEPENWPRGVYARLIDQLVQQQAALIGLNVFLKGPGDPADDARLAKAIADAGRVVLASNLRRDHVLGYRTSTELFGTLVIDTPDLPVGAFDSQALAVAPFPVPRHVSLAKHFWLYVEGDPREVTFPVAMLRALFVRNAYGELGPLLEKLEPPEFPEFDRSLGPNAERRLANGLTGVLASHPEFAVAIRQALESQGVPQVVRDLGKTWMDCCFAGDQMRFNHYGPPGTIRTYSATRLLGPEGPHDVDLRDKIVLVGYAEDLQPETNHGFYTYFSDSPDKALSSVEMAAAAIGNLIDGSAVRTLPKPALLLIVAGWALLACTMAIVGLSGRRLLAVAVLVVAYLTLAYLEFVRSNLWLPGVVPVGVVTPTVLIVAAVSRYRVLQREKRQIYEAFGLYVPKAVVERMRTERQGPHAGQGIVIERGICFYSDAGQYTRVAEELDPMALGAFMNSYYDTIFPLVKAEGGFVSDVVGDAVLALWAGTERVEDEFNAVCRCALTVHQAVMEFCRVHEVDLPIRIGVNTGPFRLGNVGTRERLEFRATGDTVNTASRMENLCKSLGTSILVAASIADQARGFIVRPLGEFLLEGKSRPVAVAELLGLESQQAGAELQWLCRQFAKGLASYRQGDLATAQTLFQRLLHDVPGDGPTMFYLAAIERLRELPENGRDTRLVSLAKS